MPRFNRMKAKKAKRKHLNKAYYDPYAGLTGVNRYIRIRPSVYALNAIRKYDRGELLKVKKLALHELVSSLLNNVPQLPYRTSYDIYRSIEAYVLYFFQREAHANQTNRTRITVPPGDMLLTRSIGSEFY